MFPPSMLDVPKSFHHTNVSGANDIYSRFVVAIVCNKKQCRILYLNIHTNNLVTYYKKILPNKFNTATHTVKEVIKSNTNQLHKHNTSIIIYKSKKLFVSTQYSMIIYDKKITMIQIHPYCR